MVLLLCVYSMLLVAFRVLFRWYRNALSWQSPRRTTKTGHVLATKPGNFNTNFLRGHYLWIPSDCRCLAGEWIDVYACGCCRVLRPPNVHGVPFCEANPTPSLRPPNVLEENQAREGTNLLWLHMVTTIIAAIAKVKEILLSKYCSLYHLAWACMQFNALQTPMPLCVRVDQYVHGGYDFATGVYCTRAVAALGQARPSSA